MTFQQLEYIVEISKCGSINKASQKLFLSQSGISTAVRELEGELGIQLLARSNRGVEFTPEGREFLSYAASLLEQKRQIEGLYGEARNSVAPAQFSVSCQRYPFAVDAFLRMLRTAEENRFRFGVRETGMDGVIDDVYDHRADVGIICLTDLTEKIIRRLLDARELDFHELAAVVPCAYVRRGHPLADRTSLTEEDLSGYPYVAFEHDQGVASDFFEEYPMATLEKARQVHQCQQPLHRHVCAGGDGCLHHRQRPALGVPDGRPGGDCSAAGQDLGPPGLDPPAEHPDLPADGAVRPSAGGGAGGLHRLYPPSSGAGVRADAEKRKGRGRDLMSRPRSSGGKKGRASRRTPGLL